MFLYVFYMLIDGDDDDDDDGDDGGWWNGEAGAAFSNHFFRHSSLHQVRLLCDAQVISESFCLTASNAVKVFFRFLRFSRVFTSFFAHIQIPVDAE